MSKPPGKCLFCGGTGLSKEHLFAQWIGREFGGRRSFASHYVSRGAWEEAVRREGNLSSRPWRQGDVSNIKLRIACKDCNTGWMSRLQAKAKPILLPFMRGIWRELNAEEFELISLWIVMSCMVSEYLDLETVAIQQTDRSRLLECQKVPNGWSIWLGKFENDENLKVWHSSLKVGQLSTFRVGRLAILALTNYDLADLEIPEFFMIANGMVRIWPLQSGHLQPLRKLSIEHFEALHVELCKIWR